MDAARIDGAGDGADGATATTAYPVWSDTRNAALFLCSGTGTTGTPPRLCHASAGNASIANDEDIYTAAVPIH